MQTLEIHSELIDDFRYLCNLIKTELDKDEYDSGDEMDHVINFAKNMLNKHFKQEK